MFFLVFDTIAERTKMINYLKEHKILAVFHYLSLHKSPFYDGKHDGRILENSDKFENTLLRIPLFYDLTEMEIKKIVKVIQNYPN